MTEPPAESTWPTLATLAARARSLRRATGRTLLGITGPPGAGKSTLAEALARATGAVVVPMDGFHLGDDELRAAGSYERKGAPETFDVDGYLALLHRLRGDAGVVHAPDFDRDDERTVPDSIPVPPGTLVITEGNYLLLDLPPWSGVRTELDECWFVETPEDLRTARLIERFVAYGWDRVAATQRVLRGSDAANARLVAGGRGRADLVVCSS